MSERVLDAPCVFCGYNGTDYWQAGTHKADCPVGEIGGRTGREEGLRSLPRTVELLSRVAELEAENAKLRKCVEAADDFVDAVVRIEGSPAMMKVYGIAEAHGLPYNGANWSGELANYRAARAEVDK